MTEQHYFANDGSDWTTPPSPVNASEAREADKALDDAAREADGPSASNETELHRTIVEDSNAANAAKDSDEEPDEAEDDPEK